MNPYAAFLGDRDPFEVIAQTVARLEQLMRTLGPSGAERSPGPGKWNVRQILCHLADTEIVFAFRLRQALAEPNHVIQPFDQDLWAKQYDAYDAAAALEVYAVTRHWNAKLIESLPPDAFTRTLTHPERGAMTFQTVVETMAGHDRNHILQIEAIASQA